MKKQITMFLAVAMAAGMLAGCSGGKAQTTASGTAAVSDTAAAETTQADTTTAAPEPASSDATAQGQTGENAGEPDRAELEPAEILVAAAASLKNAYEDELIPMFQEQNPGVTVVGTYDSSGKLQTQIEEGLEADVFMSEAPKQMNALEE